MGFLERTCRFIDRFNEAVCRASSWLILVLLLTIGYEVAARYVFNRPTIWSYEVTYFLSSFLIVMGMGYTLRIKGHVAIDILADRMSPRGRAILSAVFSLLFFFPMWFLIIKIMVPNVLSSFASNEKSWVGSWLPVIWPFKAWILAGLVMLFLQGAVELARDVAAIRKGGKRA